MRRSALLVVACLLAWTLPAEAAPTRFWITRDAADYQEAAWNQVAIDPTGVARRGREAQLIALPGAEVIWCVAGQAGGAVVGTGHAGVAYEWSRAGVQVSDSSGSGQILCWARGPGGELYAGTAPDGRVLRYRDRRFETYFETGDAYVWDLAWSDGRLYAVTGAGGHLFAITDRGQGRAVFTVPEGQATAVTGDGAGGVFFATSAQSVVYHFAKGEARALFSTQEPEIRSLAYDGDAIYAAALQVPPPTVEEARAASAKHTPSSRGGTPQSIIYRIVPDRAAAPHWIAPQGFVYALAARDGGGYWAVTGGRAGVYEVDGEGLATAHWQSEEGEATGIDLHDGAIWVALTAPSRLLRLGSAAREGTLRSDVLDAEQLTRWGRFTADGELRGARFETRSGNTETPDSTWEPWRAVRTGEPVASATARYLQWRARLTGESAVREVRVATRQVNQAPQIGSFTVHPQPGMFYEGELTPRQEPVTQILPNGQRVQFSIQNPPPGRLEVLPRWALGLRPLSWEAGDPNQDELQFRLSYRPQGAREWTLLADQLRGTSYTWDVTALAEGEYEVRLEASDELGNGEEALVARRTVRGVSIDLTPPVVYLDAPRLEGRTLVLRGRVTDRGLYVSRVEAWAEATNEWIVASPEDGLWDGPTETFRLSLRGLETGRHAVRVRAVDALGNASEQTVEVTVAP